MSPDPYAFQRYSVDTQWRRQTDCIGDVTRYAYARAMGATDAVSERD